MNKEKRVFIGHILESIQLIREYTMGVTFDDFCVSRQTQDSVIRALRSSGKR